MARRREWMRAWALFDVLPVLVYMSRVPNKHLAAARDEALAALHHSSHSRPEGAAAMSALGAGSHVVSHVGSTTGAHGVTLDTLVAEVQDLGFGSTLTEQHKFADTLTDWVSYTFPSELPLLSTTAGSRVRYPIDVKDVEFFWEGLYEVSACLVMWLPKLCMALQIDAHSSGAKRDKMLSSASVACKQIQAVERILLHALAEEHPGAMSAVVGCVWAPPSQQEAARLLGSADNCGMLSCLDQLATAGRYADPFASLQLQGQIVRTLCRLIQADHQRKQRSSRSRGSPSSAPTLLLTALVDCGLVRSLTLFLLCVVDTVHDASRDKSMIPSFTKEHKAIFSAAGLVWETLISLHDAHVVEEIIDAGILQKLAETWLPCSQSITLIGVAADAIYNPFMLRTLALTMMQTLTLHLRLNGTGGHTHRLAAEVIPLPTTHSYTTLSSPINHLHILFTHSLVYSWHVGWSVPMRYHMNSRCSVKRWAPVLTSVLHIGRPHNWPCTTSVRLLTRWLP